MVAQDTDPPGILLVEDEALIARQQSAAVERCGYRVVGIAYSAEHALEQFKAKSPDLLLVDIKLGRGMDGIEFAKLANSLRPTPVLFLTSYGDDQTMQEAKAAGPYGYIVKPIDRDIHLRAAVEMALHRHRTEMELARTRQLLMTALRCVGDALVFVDGRGRISELNEEAEALFQTRAARVHGRRWQRLFARDAAPGDLRRRVELALENRVETRLAPFLVAKRDGQQVLMEGTVGVLDDGAQEARAVLMLKELAELATPVERLPTVTEMGGAWDLPWSATDALVVMLIRGGERVPAVLERVRRSLRASDLVAVLAEETIIASLPRTDDVAGKRIARVLIDDLENAFGRGTQRFCIGLAGTGESNQSSPIALLSQAYAALRIAEQASVSTAVLWRLDRQDVPQRMPDGRRSYLQMVLLWNLIARAGRCGTRLEFAEAAVAEFQGAFRMTTTALIWFDPEREVCARSVGREGTVHDLDALTLPAAQQKLIAFLDERRGGWTAWETEDGVSWCVSWQGKTALYFYRDHGADDDLDRTFVESLMGYLSFHLMQLPSAPRLSSADEGPEPSVQTAVIARSLAMAEVLSLADRFAPHKVSVLISGESGTGKEVVAHRIHKASGRPGAFIVIDCGNMVAGLIESELFGHAKGAYTGADSQRDGLLHEADGGTLFLDEIGELPLDVQVKLLRFTDTGEFNPVGSSQRRQVDVRIVAATNRDLPKSVVRGEFRRDLYHRLSVAGIEVPPLRERREDLPPLVEHYLAVHSRECGKHFAGLTDEAMAAIMAYGWPGNARELINAIQRAVILCTDDRIGALHLSLPAQAADTETEGGVPAEAEEAWRYPALLRQLDAEIEDFVRDAVARDDTYPVWTWLEEDLLLATFDSHGEVILRTATKLGMPESTVRRRLGKIRAAYAGEAPGRPRDWAPVADSVRRLVATDGRSDGRRLSQLPGLMCDLVVRHSARYADSRTAAAALVGVSLPTYRRLLRQMEANSREREAKEPAHAGRWLAE